MFSLVGLAADIRTVCTLTTLSAKSDMCLIICHGIVTTFMNAFIQKVSEVWRIFILKPVCKRVGKIYTKDISRRGKLRQCKHTQ